MGALAIKIIGALVTCAGAIISGYGMKVEMDERAEQRQKSDAAIMKSFRD